MNQNSLRGTGSGPCIIIGNGPSLNVTPQWVSEYYPTFACNFFPYYQPGVPVDYLTMIDRKTIQSAPLWSRIRRPTKVLCFERWIDDAPDHEADVYSWANRDDLIPGFTAGSVYGQYFPTSGHAAVWLADLIGFDEFYLIGMDGTSQQRELDGVDDEGKSNVPHFYDEHPAKNSTLWDIAWGNLYRYMRHEKGKEIINLTPDTAITQLPKVNYAEHFKSHPNSGLWAEYQERGQRSMVQDAGIRD